MSTKGRRKPRKQKKQVAQRLIGDFFSAHSPVVPSKQKSAARSQCAAQGAACDATEAQAKHHRSASSTVTTPARTDLKSATVARRTLASPQQRTSTSADPLASVSIGAHAKLALSRSPASVPATRRAKPLSLSRSRSKTPAAARSRHAAATDASNSPGPKRSKLLALNKTANTATAKTQPTDKPTAGTRQHGRSAVPSVPSARKSPAASSLPLPPSPATAPRPPAAKWAGLLSLTKQHAQTSAQHGKETVLGEVEEGRHGTTSTGEAEAWGDSKRSKQTQRARPQQLDNQPRQEEQRQRKHRCEHPLLESAQRGNPGDNETQLIDSDTDDTKERDDVDLGCNGRRGAALSPGSQPHQQRQQPPQKEETEGEEKEEVASAAVSQRSQGSMPSSGGLKRTISAAPISPHVKVQHTSQQGTGAETERSQSQGGSAHPRDGRTAPTRTEASIQHAKGSDGGRGGHDNGDDDEALPPQQQKQQQQQQQEESQQHVRGQKQAEPPHAGAAEDGMDMPPSQDSVDTLLCQVDVEAAVQTAHRKPAPCHSSEAATTTEGDQHAQHTAAAESHEDERDGSGDPDPLQRFHVLSVAGDYPEKALVLQGLSRRVRGKQWLCLLRDEWARTEVEAEDVVEVIGSFHPPNSSSSSNDNYDSSSSSKAGQTAPARTTATCIVSAKANFIIVHPDVLVATTRVATSFQCLRKAVLSEHFRSSDVTTPAMAYGTLLHLVFQSALQQDDFSFQYLHASIRSTLRAEMELLYAIGVSEADAEKELSTYVGALQAWSQRFLGANPQESVSLDAVNNRVHQDRIAITGLRDIEEACWSPRFGLKASIDATVGVAIHRRHPRPRWQQEQRRKPEGGARKDRQRAVKTAGEAHVSRAFASQPLDEGKLGRLECAVCDGASTPTATGSSPAYPSVSAAPSAHKRAGHGVGTRDDDDVTKGHMLMPLEVKTGRPIPNGSSDHRAQVILYALVMNELGHNTAAGLLYYMKSGDMYGVPLHHPELVALLGARNALASYLKKENVYPPVLQSESACSRCYHINLCTAVHASVEDGTAETFGLREEFASRTEHLTQADRCYMRHWLQLIAHEDAVASEDTSRLWRSTASALEEQHLCLANLVMVDVLSTPDEESTASDGQTQGQTCELERARGSAPFSSPQSSTARCGAEPTAPPPPRASFVYAFARVDHTSGRRVPFPASPFQRGDHVVLSTQRPRHAAVRTGRVASVTADHIAVAFDQPVRQITSAAALAVEKQPSTSAADDVCCPPGRAGPHVRGSRGSGVGGVPASQHVQRGVVYRLDRDPAVYTGRTYRGHLFSLFGSNLPVKMRRYQPPSQATQLETDVKARRRALLVNLDPPRFVAELPETETATVARMCAEFQLNDVQREAVRRVLCAEDYCLIQGMPGTGKTTTIACLVAAMAELGLSVLLTAYTHSAVDNVLLKVRHRLSGQFVRLGGVDRIHPQLRDHAAAVMRERHETVSQLASAYHRTPVVATTCLGLNHAVLERRQFDFCIVDEASQITQAACLGPISHAKKFVLVGDHQQLPPLVRSQRAREGGMDVSMFKRLASASPTATVVLSTQYRMCAEIMRLSNTITYNNELTCGTPAVAAQRLGISKDALLQSTLPPWLTTALLPDSPTVFLDTAGVPRAREQRDGKVLFNPAEVGVVADLCTALVQRLGTAQDDVGVIVPYRAQLRRIQARLHGRHGLRGVECNTVDRYQGRDKVCIVVSLVRSNAAGLVGDLLQDQRRVNVALTRAKAKLILVGCSATLKTSAPLAAVIQMAQESGWLIRLPAALGDSGSQGDNTTTRTVNPA